MTEQSFDGVDARGLDRRHLLMAGGAAAAVAAAGATVLGAGPASAVPLVPVLAPVSPVRLFDSRESVLGPIANGYTDTLTGSSTTYLAFLLNVTVVDTQGFGWITVFSADLTSVPGTSTLNWYGPNQTMVNTAYTYIRASDAGIKVNCGGGGQANYVLDLTAVLFMYDAGAAAASIPATVDAAVSSAYSAFRS
jgi:hypothetical protein